MIEIEKPRIETEELAEDGSYGRFSIEPLERGQEDKGSDGQCGYNHGK